MADITTNIEVGAEWVTLVSASDITFGVVSWKEPFELYIFVTSADVDVPGGEGHRMNAAQQAGRSVFPSGCIKGRSVDGLTVIVAVTAG
jgi:hypothetical protein